MSRRTPRNPAQTGAITGDAPGPDTLVTGITTFLATQDPRTLAGLREMLEREVQRAGPRALIRLEKRLTGAGADWSYYRSDPLARRVHHFLADRLLDTGSTLLGTEHLAVVANDPVVLVANHLSYSDANLLEVLLFRHGGVGLSDRLTVVAGPKVYSSLKRRFSSLCFGTIKTPQNSARSSEDAVMSPREVARAARRSIEIAHDRLRLGDAVLVFAEGTRSRNAEMQPLLSGVTRYLDGPPALVLPVGIVGTEVLFPVGDDTLHPVRAVAHLGRPIPAGVLLEQAGGDRRLVMDVVGLAVAAVLPPEYRGVYADDAPDLDAARRVLSHLFD